VSYTRRVIVLWEKKNSKLYLQYNYGTVHGFVWLGWYNNNNIIIIIIILYIIVFVVADGKWRAAVRPSVRPSHAWPSVTGLPQCLQRIIIIHGNNNIDINGRGAVLHIYSLTHYSILLLWNRTLRSPVTINLVPV